MSNPLEPVSGAALDALRELYEQTTPGPWTLCVGHFSDHPTPECGCYGRAYSLGQTHQQDTDVQIYSPPGTYEKRDSRSYANAEFIVALVNAFPALLTEHTALRAERDTRQREIAAWTRTTFGDRTMTPTERAARFIEEAIELAQASGLPADMIVKLTGHVYAKPVGEVAQGFGGVGITLLALAEATGTSAAASERAEWERVRAKSVDHFRKRHAAKAAVGICFDTDPVSSELDAARRSPTTRGET